MKKISIIIITIVLLLWFADFLPKLLVKTVANSYISQQEDSVTYKLKGVEYSPKHGCYFAYYQNEDNSNEETRNIGVYYRWFPIWVYFDSAYPG